MDWLLMGLFAVGLYLAGAVNFSILVAKRLDRPGDLRNMGSGNAGATNLARYAGKKVGLMVLMLDIVRAALLMILAEYLFIHFPWRLLVLPMLAGNIFPIFHRFKGGKGVAMTLGSLMVVAPGALVAGAFLFLAALFGYRRVSFASLSLVTGATVFSVNAYGVTDSRAIVCALIAFIIFGTHHQNIYRLLNNEEPPLW